MMAVLWYSIEELSRLNSGVTRIGAAIDFVTGRYINRAKKII